MLYGTLAEKKELQRKSGYWAGGALLFAFATAFLIPLVASAQSGGGLFASLVLATRLVAAVLWVIGCDFYVRSKGWSRGMGILGILTCIGVLVLVVLPDKWGKELKERPVGPSGPADLTNYPR